MAFRKCLCVILLAFVAMVARADHFTSVDHTQYQNYTATKMTVMMPDGTTRYPVGTEVAAFVNGECRAAGKVQASKTGVLSAYLCLLGDYKEKFVFCVWDGENEIPCGGGTIDYDATAAMIKKTITAGHMTADDLEDGGWLTLDKSLWPEVTSLQLDGTWTAEQVATAQSKMGENGLIYIASSDESIAGKENVVIVNGDSRTAAHLRLTGGKSFAPLYSFTSADIQLSRSLWVDGGWETLMLPFTPTSVQDAEGKECIDEFVCETYGGTDASAHTISFDRIAGGLASAPVDQCMIVSHKDAVASSAPLLYNIMYAGEAVTIAAASAHTTDKGVVGVYTPHAVTEEEYAGYQVYVLNAAGTKWTLAKSTVTIPPFCGYFSPETSSGVKAFSVVRGEEDPDAILGVSQTKAERVYDLTGRKAHHGGIIIRGGKKYVKE